MPEERARGPHSRTKTGKGRYMLLRTLDRFHGKHTSPLAGTLPFAMGSGAQFRLILRNLVLTPPQRFLVLLAPSTHTLVSARSSRKSRQSPSQSRLSTAGKVRLAANMVWEMQLSHRRHSFPAQPENKKTENGVSTWEWVLRSCSCSLPMVLQSVSGTVLVSSCIALRS